MNFLSDRVQSLIGVIVVAIVWMPALLFWNRELQSVPGDSVMGFIYFAAMLLSSGSMLLLFVHSGGQGGQIEELRKRVRTLELLLTDSTGQHQRLINHMIEAGMLKRADDKGNQA